MTFHTERNVFVLQKLAAVRRASWTLKTSHNTFVLIPSRSQFSLLHSYSQKGPRLSIYWWQRLSPPKMERSIPRSQMRRAFRNGDTWSLLLFNVREPPSDTNCHLGFSPHGGPCQILKITFTKIPNCIWCTCWWGAIMSKNSNRINIQKQPLE